MGMIRSFIAFETPDHVRRIVREIQQQLQQAKADVRWETEEKFHVTIKFLGDVNENKLPQIISQIEETVTKYPIYNVKYEKLGFFPNKHSPRVIWIGCTNPDTTLISIKEELEENLINYGFESEKRKFTPHITLGRIKSLKNINNLISTSEKINFEPMTAYITHITVMRSVLEPQGSQYSILKKIPLKL